MKRLILFLLITITLPCYAITSYDNYGNKTGIYTQTTHYDKYGNKLDTYKQTNNGYNTYDVYGNKTGSYKTNNDITTHYDKYGNRLETYKQNGNTINSYDKYGNRTGNKKSDETNVIEKDNKIADFDCDIEMRVLEAAFEAKLTGLEVNASGFDN